MIIENIHFSSEINGSIFFKSFHRQSKSRISHQASAFVKYHHTQRRIIRETHFPQASLRAAQKPLYHSSKFSSVLRDAAASARDIPSATI